MTKKNINLILIICGIGFLAAIVVLAGAFDNNKAGQNASASSAYSNGVLAVENNNYDFGTISMANGDVSYRFEIKNSGEETVKIEKVYTSCMCTAAAIIDGSGKKLGVFGMPGHGGTSSNANIEVKNGETIIVEAIFDPAAHGPKGIGKIKRLIYLETNSKTKPKIQLEIKADVIK